MRKLVLIAVALLWSSAAFTQSTYVCPNAPATCAADVACLSWQPPTTWTDGKPLTIKTYTAHYGTSANALTQVRAIPYPTACSASITGLAPATYYFCLDVTADTGEVSDCSNIVTKTIGTVIAKQPNAPASLKVTSMEVYQVIGTTDQFQFLPVGTVSTDTACITTQQINGYYAVPTASVTWYGSVHPKVVVAKCN